MVNKYFKLKLHNKVQGSDHLNDHDFINSDEQNMLGIILGIVGS